MLDIPKWFPSLSLHTCRHRDPAHNVLKTSFHGFHCAWGNADNAHCLKNCLLHIMAKHKQSFQTSSHSASHTGAQDGGCNSSLLYPSTSGNGCYWSKQPLACLFRCNMGAFMNQKWLFRNSVFLSCSEHPLETVWSEGEVMSLCKLQPASNQVE